jgi:hypothetical protein
MSAEYREHWMYLWKLALGHTQRVCLTASMPLTSMHNFMETAALSIQFTRIVRGPTNRPEHRYYAVRVDAKTHSVHSVVVNLARALQAEFQLDSRGIIFASTVQDAQEVATAMDAFQHHTEVSVDQKEKNVRHWKEGVRYTESGAMRLQPWMVATPGLMYGVDLERIDAVIFDEEGMPGLVGGAQGAGRAGRRGRPSVCLFVTTGTFNPTPKGADFSGVKKMQEWTRVDKCLRITPSGFLDGIPVTCEMLFKEYPTTEFCGYCRPNAAMTQLISRAIETADKPSHATNMSGLGDLNELPMECFAGIAPTEPFCSHNTPASTFASTPKAILASDRSQGPEPSWSDFVTPSAPPPSSAPPTYHRDAASSQQTQGALQEPSDKGVRAHASMPIIMNAALANSVEETKLLKTAVLDRLILRVRSFCYSCYILTGKYRPRDHHRILQCGTGGTFGMGWQSFKKSWILSFPNCHFCTSCGIPQDVKFRSFGPPSHPNYGKDCNVEDMIPTMLFALKRNPPTWKLVAASAKLPIAMTDQEFAAWVKIYALGTTNYYNGLELVIWVITEILKHDTLRGE